MRIIHLLILAFGLDSPAILAAAGQSPGVTATEITFGQSAAFLGASASLGAQLWRGADAFFSNLNADGGVNGRKITVVSLDDHYEGEETLVNTIKLVTEQKVFGLFGYVGTPTIVKALPAIQKFSSEGLFLFSNFTGAQPQREPPHNRYVFNVRASYRTETAAIIKKYLDLGFKRIGMFTQDDAYGRSGIDGVTRALKERELSIIAETTYKRGTTIDQSMAEQVGVLKKAGVDAIVSVGSYAACAAFIRDLRKSGSEVPVANLSFVGPDALLDALVQIGKDAHTDLTRRLIGSQVVPAWNDLSVPLVKEYRSAMDGFSHNLPEAIRDPGFKPRKYSFGSLEGYLNAKVLALILKKISGEPTRQAFFKAAEDGKAMDVGLNEKISFGPDDHIGLSTVFLTEIQNGAYIPFKDWVMVK